MYQTMEQEQEILSRLRQGDPEAVRTIVERHGRMVYNVCRRMLGDATESEDAAQAVFLLLLQKRAALGQGTVLASWLYRASVFVAGKALRSRLRRKQHERKAARRMDDRQGTSREDWERLKPDLDRAIADLPEHLRAPIVLSYLEGRPGAEAAAILGLPQRTFYDRLSKGLDRLRRKFAGRALLALSPVGLASHALEYAAPAGLTTAVVQSAGCAAVGGAAGTAAVQLILEEVMKAVFWSKVRITVAVVAAVVLSVGITVPVTKRFIETPYADDGARESANNVAALGSQAGSNDSAEAADLKRRVAALELENSLLRNAAAGEQAASPAETGAAGGENEDIESPLRDLPWETIGAAVAKDAIENKGGGHSAEMVAALMPHLPKLLKLQQMLGAKSIEDVFAEYAVMEHLIPAYAKQLGQTTLSAEQTAQVAAVMQNVQAAHNNLENEELPAFATVIGAIEMRNALGSIIGEELTSKMMDAELVSVQHPDWMNVIVQFHSNDQKQSDSQLGQSIASSWISSYGLEPSTEATLLPFATQLASVIRSRPASTSLPASFHEMDPVLISANGQAMAQILRSVPLTEAQRHKIRHTLSLNMIQNMIQNFTWPANRD